MGSRVHKHMMSVPVGGGAIMSVPWGELEWKLRYGYASEVGLVAASVIESYEYLLHPSITGKEAERRLRILRREYRAALKAQEVEDG